MQFQDCETIRILENSRKITKKDMFTLIYGADTKEDFFVQNYIQKQLVAVHGRSFIEKSQSRIETVLYFLTQKEDENLYDMYIKSFDAFMKTVDNDYDKSMDFNIIFIFYINIARRLLRQSADKYSPREK